MLSFVIAKQKRQCEIHLTLEDLLLQNIWNMCDDGMYVNIYLVKCLILNPVGLIYYTLLSKS